MSRTPKVAVLVLGLGLFASRTAKAQALGAVPVTATVGSAAPATNHLEVGRLVSEWRVHPRAETKRSTEYGRLELIPPPPGSPVRSAEAIVVTIQYLRN